MLSVFRCAGRSETIRPSTAVRVRKTQPLLRTYTVPWLAGRTHLNCRSAKYLLKLSLVCLLLLSSLLACDILPKNSPLAASATPADSSPDSGSPLNSWIQATPGVALRYEQWKSPSNDQDTVTIVRFDLHQVHLSVGYQPDNPMFLSDWVRQMPGALAMINGGYFDSHHRATALVVSNGQVSGQSYPDFGGMLSVDAQGAITLRSLKQQPVEPDEQLQQATQSSPMLVLNGKRTQFSANSASQRRSVVAIDQQGHLLLIVSPSISFTLDELADLLVKSDLGIQTALNLDGGASTGLYINAGHQKVSLNSAATLPIVIVIK